MGVGGDVATASADTPWRHGRFDAERGTQQVLFGRVWEDPAIERSSFAPGGRVLCIASAGCTAIALAPDHRVTAVDINPAQLRYAAARIAGAPPRAGTAERLMGAARAFGGLVGWSRDRMRAFAELDDPDAQLAYWRAHLDTRRFRVALDTLLSRRLLSAIYGAPFLAFLPPSFGPILRARLERGIARHGNRSNPHARALFAGDVAAPIADDHTNDAVELVHADAAEYLERAPRGSFEGFALSNILDGATDAYRRRLFAAIDRAAAPNAVMIRRSFGEEPIADNRAADDRAMLWGVVEVSRIARR